MRHSRGPAAARSTRRQLSGQALVEASLVMPVLLLVVLTGIDFGRLYTARVTVTDAARQAARYGAANPTDQSATGPCGTGTQVWRGSVATARQEAAGGSVSIGCDGVSLRAGGPDAYGGSFVTADVRAPFSFITPFLTSLLTIDHVTGSDTAREAPTPTGAATPTPGPMPTPRPTPTPAPTVAPVLCTHGGQAWAAAVYGVATAGGKNGKLTVVADATVGDSGPLPATGGTVNSGPLASFAVAGVLSGTVATDRAAGAGCAGSASTNIASVAVLPGQGPLGADIADVTAVAGTTAQACGSGAVQSSSVASVTIAGVTVTILPGVNNQVVNLPGVATVYVNNESQGSVSSPPSVDVVKIAFPTTGRLSSLITGTVVIGHAQQSCAYS